MWEFLMNFILVTSGSYAGVALYNYMELRRIRRMIREDYVQQRAKEIYGQVPVA